MRSGLPHLLACVVLAFAALASPVQAAETIWSGLIYASNEEDPAPTPKELAGYGAKLKELFGYNQIQLVSEHRESMEGLYGHWLLPGKGFCLLANTKKSPERGYLLNLALFQEKRLLVRAQTRLGRQSPIFLRGPLCGKGQLVIVVTLE
jgi:hypothetical protein